MIIRGRDRNDFASFYLEEPKLNYIQEEDRHFDNAESSQLLNFALHLPIF
jgi:hypothetical protein